ncbi:MAG: hypothetical protein II461_09050, partial [Treponema sp.]|nr:hypothetical protein [Treponema sp.]
MAKKKKKPDFSKPKPVKTPEQDVEIVSAFEKSPDTDSENSDTTNAAGTENADGKTQDDEIRSQRKKVGQKFYPDQ